MKLDPYEELIEKATATLDSGDLDDIVHEIKSGEAASINNQGIDVQLEYIEESLGKEETAKLLKGLIEGEY